MSQNKEITEGEKQVSDILSQKYNEQIINSLSSNYPNLYKKLEESKTTKEKVDAISNAIDDLKFFAKELIPVNESDNWLKDKTSYGKCAYWCTPLFKSTKSVINMLY